MIMMNNYVSMKRPTDGPRKFEREYKNDDGSVDVWKYNLDIHPYGPIETTHIEPKGQPKQRKKKNKFTKNDEV